MANPDNDASAREETARWLEGEIRWHQRWMARNSDDDSGFYQSNEEILTYLQMSLECVRGDVHPSNAALAICETMLTLYSASGEWLNDEEGTSRLWRMLQVVNGAPRSQGERWATDEAILRPFVARMTGKTVEEITDRLSRFLHELRFGAPVFADDVPGMVVTDLDAWEGEDGG